MQQNWLGLRPDDLGEQERTQLERDLQLSAVHRAELNFGQHLEQLPYLGRVIVLDDIRTYAERMGPFSSGKKSLTWLYGLPLVLVVFGMLMVLALSNESGQDPMSLNAEPQALLPQLDLLGEPEAVSITAWASQQTGERPLLGGEDLQVTERLGVQVSMKGSGHVIVGDLGTGERLFPAEQELFFLEDGAYKVGRDNFEFFDFSSRIEPVQLRALSCDKPVVGFPQAVPQGCLAADFEFQIAR